MSSIIWIVGYVLFIVCPPVFALLGLIRRSSKLMYIAAVLSIPISFYFLGMSQSVLLAITMLLILPFLLSLSGYLMHRSYFLSVVLALLPIVRRQLSLPVALPQ